MQDARTESAAAEAATPKYREVYGFMKNGERVHLGNCKMTDDEKQRFLDQMAAIYASQEKESSADRVSPVFNVKDAVFDARSFAGVQVSK